MRSQVFAVAAQRAGVALSTPDLLALGERFAIDPALSSQRGTAYGRFLKWAAAAPQEGDSNRKLLEKVAAAHGDIGRLMERRDRDESQRLSVSTWLRVLLEDARVDADEGALRGLAKAYLDPRGDVMYVCRCFLFASRASFAGVFLLPGHRRDFQVR